MSSYQFTPQAVEDLFEIWSHIAGDDLDAANRVEDAVHTACAFLVETPRAGSVREDLTALPLRFWLVKPYRITGLCTIQKQCRCASFGSSMRLGKFRTY